MFGIGRLGLGLFSQQVGIKKFFGIKIWLGLSNLIQNLHFWSFWAKYWHFWHMLSNARPKYNVNKVLRWVFCYVGNKLLISPVEKGIFCPKTAKFGPKLAFLVNLGQGMHLVPCWWVGWWLWRAGCISQDTYLLYLILQRTSKPVHFFYLPFDQDWCDYFCEPLQIQVML